MNHRLLTACAALLLALLASAATAAQRTFVSVAGSDSNVASNCSNAHPCRGLAAAMGATDTDGEIIVQDSGGYGPITITKSISIVAPPGIYAGISVAVGSGVVINAPGADILLRGLSINGIGGSDGINMANGSSVIIDRCFVEGFKSGAGVRVAAAAKVRLVDSVLKGNLDGLVLSAGAKALVSGSRLLDHDNVALWSIAQGSGVETRAVFVRSEASGNGTGLYASSGSSGRSVLHAWRSAVSNSSSGFVADSSSSTTEAGVYDSLLTNNILAVDSYGAGTWVVASGNRALGNTTAMKQESTSLLETTGDNTLRDNGSDTLGSVSGVSKL